MLTTDANTNEDLAALIGATVPSVTATLTTTGGNCGAILITGDAGSLLLTDGDADYPMADGRYGYALYLATDDDDATVLLELDAYAVESTASAEVTRRIIAAIHAWSLGTTVEDIAKGVVDDIRDDIAIGQVPSNVPNFSTLHDYVDANEYLMDRAPLGESGDTDADLALTNVVTGRVDTLIGAGHLTERLSR